MTIEHYNEKDSRIYKKYFETPTIMQKMGKINEMDDDIASVDSENLKNLLTELKKVWHEEIENYNYQVRQSPPDDFHSDEFGEDDYSENSTP